MRLISNEKGVTMVSLVITVIIMIILTAVSLNGAFGEGSNNSLVERAKNARYKAEVEDLKDFWEAKLVDVDTTYLNYDSLEDVMDEEQIPESLRGVFAVKQGRLVYKDDFVDESKKEILKEFEIYSTFVDPIEISIKAKIKKITAAKSADVIVVIDASGSMKNSPDYRYENAVPALNNLMSTVLQANENNRIGIVSFDYYYDVLLHLNNYKIKNGYSEYVTLKDYKNTSTPVGVFNVTPNQSKHYIIDGGTNVSAGIAKAEYMFKKRTEAERKNKKDYIVILSDGESSSIISDPTYDIIDTKFVEDDTDDVGWLDKYWYRASASGNSGIYKSIKFIKEVKDKHEGELKIYTINYSDSTQSKVTMNPTEENINKLSSSSYKSEMKALGNYADEAYSQDDPNFDLNNIFSKIGQDIIKKDETVFDMDTAERVGDVIIENKMQFYDENGNLVDYTLDEAEGDVVINVNASVFVPTGKKDASGNIIRAADTTRTRTYSKSYTIEEIKSGADPNIKYENGNIVWNIESDFDKNATNNIKAEAINLLSAETTYDSSIGEEMGIKNVEIILPLVTYEE